MREPAAPGKPIELPPDVARRFFKDLRAFLAEKNTAVQDSFAMGPGPARPPLARRGLPPSARSRTAFGTQGLVSTNHVPLPAASPVEAVSSQAATLGIFRSTNRNNRVLRVPATKPSAAASARPAAGRKYFRRFWTHS
jgi:hypothetical protein